MGWRALCVGALLVVSPVVTACSGSDAGQAPDASTAVPSGTGTGAEVAPDPVSPDPAGAGEIEPPPLSAWSVHIDTSTPDIDGELSGTLADSDDPFGQFVSCAGLRDRFGTYSVFASAVGGDVRSISVLSTDLVAVPGTHDASVRVEFASLPAIDAVGTVTIASDYRSGTYVAFDLDGERVEGTFDCSGPSAPQPIAVGETDDKLEAVEIFALLRIGDAQRVVGLAVESERLESIECPGATGAQPGSAVVRVVGDELIGAISEFALTGGAPATLQMAVGAEHYDFDGVQLGGADTPGAGTFTGESGDLTVDGAFRCS